MFDRVMTAGFQHIDEAHQIGVDIGVGILDGVTHSRLRGQIDHSLWTIFLEGFHQRHPVFQTGAHLSKASLGLQPGQPRQF